MIPRRDMNLVGAAAGWQGRIKGTNVSVTGTPTVDDLDGNANNNTGAQADLQGASLGAGTYYYFLPVAGCANLDVTLRLGSGTAPTITLYPTLDDNVTLKGTATSVATVTGTQATTQLTTLRGERGCILKLVAVASFMLDQASYSAL